MNTRPSAALLSALGLDSHTEPLHVETLPQIDAAEGLAVSPSATVQELYLNSPLVAVALAASFGDHVKVRAVQRDPRVLLVESRGTMTRSHGAVAFQPDGFWSVDTRTAPAGLVFDQEVGVVVEGNAVLSYSLESEVARKLKEWSPSAEGAPAFDLASLLQSAPAQAWLRSRAQEYGAATQGYSRAIAAGLVARYWKPARGEQHLLAAMAGDSPLHRALDWFRALDPAAKGAVLEAALAETDELASILDGMADALDFSDGGAAYARLLAVRRDDLECVAALAGQEQAGKALRAALAALDRRAASWNSLWPEVSLGGDERLLALASEEPDCWWALGGAA
jgi:hypothetical protein